MSLEWKGAGPQADPRDPAAATPQARGDSSAAAALAERAKADHDAYMRQLQRRIEWLDRRRADGKRPQHWWFADRERREAEQAEEERRRGGGA